MPLDQGLVVQVQIFIELQLGIQRTQELGMEVLGQHTLIVILLLEPRELIVKT